MRPNGAQEKTRTSTALRPQVPETCASTNSATWAGAAFGAAACSAQGPGRQRRSAVACDYAERKVKRPRPASRRGGWREARGARQGAAHRMADLSFKPLAGGDEPSRIKAGSDAATCQRVGDILAGHIAGSARRKRAA